MAASVAATMAVSAGSVVSLRNGSGLSSSSAFGSPLVNVAPMRPAAKRYVMVARAALPAEQSGRAARREILAGFLAVGAAFTTAGGAMAASGPGTPGAERTNEKAGELLKAADDLTNMDSPPRFGPGREGGASEGGQVAEKAGAGAVEGLQGGAGETVEGAKSAVEQAKENFTNIFSNINKTADVGDASILDSASEKLSNLGSATDAVKSSLSSTTEKAESLKPDAGGLLSKADSVSDSAGSLVADAQSKVDTATTAKGSFDDVVSKVKSVLPK